MPRSWSSKAALVALTLLPLVAQRGCTFVNKPTAKGTKTVTAQHAQGSAIKVETRNGSVEIIADATRSDVQIDATIVCEGETQQDADSRLAQVRLDTARDTARTLIIKPDFPGDARGSDGASFVIRLPDADGIDVVTSNGRVAVTSLGGGLTIKTSNGSVNAIDHAGPASITCSNGSITIKNLSGELDARTSNGSVSATGVRGRATIHTSNSRIDLELDPANAGPIVLDTSNGSIHVQVGKAFVGDVALDTSNGTVTVIGDGVRTDHSGKTSAVAHLGSGAKSTVKTSNGSISFAVSTQ